MIGTSIGVAVAPDDGFEPDQLLKNADMALYRAKADGRGTFRFFEPEMDARLQARRLLELDLRKALAAGEFELYYQPLVNVAGERDQRLRGAAALASSRARHGLAGRVHSAGGGDRADRARSANGCCGRPAWRPRPGRTTLHVAVNFSPAQFRSRNLVPSVVSALASSGLHAEPTRTGDHRVGAAAGQRRRRSRRCTSLRELGVRISMDDFGTGYSSLELSAQVSRSTRSRSTSRSSRSFPSGSEAMAIIRAVTGLGGQPRHFDDRRGCGNQRTTRASCAPKAAPRSQGYLFSKPRPASEIGGFLAGHEEARR